LRRGVKALSLVAAFLVIAGLLAAGCGGGGESNGGAEKAGNTTADVRTVEGDTSGEEVARQAGEQLLYDYFEAIDEGRYRDAFEMRTMSLQPDADYDAFAASYSDYVKSVRVVSVKRLPEFSSMGREEFQVELDATYVKPYPAGSGQIPTFFILVPHPDREGAWLIESEGTGP